MKKLITSSLVLLALSLSGCGNCGHTPNAESNSSNHSKNGWELDAIFGEHDKYIIYKKVTKTETCYLLTVKHSERTSLSCTPNK